MIRCSPAGPGGPLAVFDVRLGWGDRLRFVSADGRYRIDGLIAGDKGLSVSAPGLAPVRM